MAELGSETRESSVGTENSARGQSAAPETGSHSRAGAHALPPCPKSVPPVRRACPGAHADLLVVLPSVPRATLSWTPRMAPRAAQISRAELCRTPGHARLRHRGPGGGAPSRGARRRQRKFSVRWVGCTHLAQVEVAVRRGHAVRLGPAAQHLHCPVVGVDGARRRR